MGLPDWLLKWRRDCLEMGVKSLHSSGVVTDFLGRSVGPVFMGQAFREDWTA